MCCDTPANFAADYMDISFFTKDGLKLAGWYLPSRNGAVIILIHSYYGDRRQTLPVAKMLYSHGYGLLMFDQRASGESEGRARSLGVLDIPDVDSATKWIRTQEKDANIGAYGCSIGGAIAVAGALDTPDIQAIALDAPSPMVWLGDLPPLTVRDPFSRPTLALYYATITLITGSSPTTNTLENIRSYKDRPVLLISTGQGSEYVSVNAYFEAASEPKVRWNIPNSSHCAAAITHPQEYEQHLVDFFNSTLLK
jgi:alpha-beta hydrolase superfamily lysophospholipase